MSVILTSNSWNDPESCTATRKARSVDAVTVFSEEGLSCFPSGSAVTETSALPWSPAGEEVVVVPWIRRHTDSIAVDEARSGFAIIVESGTFTSVMLCCWRTAFDASRK